MMRVLSQFQTKKYVPFWYQILWFIVLLIGAFICSYRINNRFTSKEPVIDGNYVSNAQIDASSQVHVGMFLHRFSRFEVLQDIFTADLIIWFEHDPKKVPEKIIEKFIFENGAITQKNLIKTEIKGTRQKSFYAVKVDFRSMLNYKDFPLDDHRISLVLSNLSTEPAIVFESSPQSFTYSQQLFFAGWRVVGSSVVSSWASGTLDHGHDIAYQHQSITFSLDCMRHDLRHMLSLLFPLFIILLIMLFCFSLNTDNLYDSVGRMDNQHMQNMLALLLFAFSTLISYRFVIESLSPNVDYFMLSDYLFFLLLAIILMIFIGIIQPYRIPVLTKMIIIALAYSSVIALLALVPG